MVAAYGLRTILRAAQDFVSHCPPATRPATQPRQEIALNLLILVDRRSGSELCQRLDGNCIGDEVSTFPLLRTSQVHVFPMNFEWMVGQPPHTSDFCGLRQL